MILLRDGSHARHLECSLAWLQKYVSSRAAAVGLDLDVSRGGRVSPTAREGSHGTHSNLAGACGV